MSSNRKGRYYIIRHARIILLRKPISTWPLRDRYIRLVAHAVMEKKELWKTYLKSGSRA